MSSTTHTTYVFFYGFFVFSLIIINIIIFYFAEFLKQLWCVNKVVPVELDGVAGEVDAVAEEVGVAVSEVGVAVSEVGVVVSEVSVAVSEVGVAVVDVTRVVSGVWVVTGVWVVVVAEEVATVVVQVSTYTASAGFVVHPMHSLLCLGGPWPRPRKWGRKRKREAMGELIYFISHDSLPNYI